MGSFAIFEIRCGQQTLVIRRDRLSGFLQTLDVVCDRVFDQLLGLFQSPAVSDATWQSRNTGGLAALGLGTENNMKQAS
jgi:hypothetical protein